MHALIGKVLNCRFILGHKLIGCHHADIFISDLANIRHAPRGQLSGLVNRNDGSKIRHAIADAIDGILRAQQRAAPGDVQAQCTVTAGAHFGIHPFNDFGAAAAVRAKICITQNTGLRLSQACAGNQCRGRQRNGSQFCNTTHHSSSHQGFINFVFGGFCPSFIGGPMPLITPGAGCPLAVFSRGHVHSSFRVGRVQRRRCDHSIRPSTNRPRHRGNICRPRQPSS